MMASSFMVLNTSTRIPSEELYVPEDLCVPEELWMEVHNIVQEAENKTIPQKKKSEKARLLSEEDLQIPKERRQAKSKGEKERYTQLNTEFQRIARRDKKTFFNEQCIKIPENNRRGKTRDLIRKVGNIKGTFHPKMGTIKDRKVET